MTADSPNTSFQQASPPPLSLSKQSPLTIRADATSKIGVGHVMRCMALAQAWQKQSGKVHLVGNIESKSLRDRLTREGITHTAMGHCVASKEDEALLISSTEDGAWVAIDGYQFDYGYQQAILSAGRKTLVLDDINDRKQYAATLLLNQNCDASTYDYVVDSGTTLLTGLDYALIRNEFLTSRPSPPLERKRILLTMGGADPENLTMQGLIGLGALQGLDVTVDVIVGPSNPHHEDLIRLAKTMPIPCEVHRAVTDMPKFMGRASFAITAAGSTCWELCVMGTPMLVVITADNQMGIGATLKRVNAGVLLDKKNLAREVAAESKSLIGNRKKLVRMSTTASGLIDGQGAMRVVNAMISI